VKCVVIRQEVIRYHGNKPRQERGDSNCSLYNFEARTVPERRRRRKEEKKKKKKNRRRRTTKKEQIFL
jgi:hypothetical protein